MKALRIGICGNGTVGGGTLQLLREGAARLQQRAGMALAPTRRLPGRRFAGLS